MIERTQPGAGARRQLGLSLMDLMGTLVVIVGLVAAGAYYKGRPADDPKTIDATLPDFAQTMPRTASTNYYLEGTIHAVQRSESGVYFVVKASSGEKYFVVATPALTGGMRHIAAGQVGALQVQTIAGQSLAAATRVVSPSETLHAFAYKYMVKEAAPANYQDPEERQTSASVEPASVVAPRPKDEDDDD